MSVAAHLTRSGAVRAPQMRRKVSDLTPSVTAVQWHCHLVARGRKERDGASWPRPKEMPTVVGQSNLNPRIPWRPSAASRGALGKASSAPKSTGRGVSPWIRRTPDIAATQRPRPARNVLPYVRAKTNAPGRPMSTHPSTSSVATNTRTQGRYLVSFGLPLTRRNLTRRWAAAARGMCTDRGLQF